MRSFSVQLPANVADWVGKVALRKEKTPEKFLRELIITSLEEEAMPLTLRLQRLDELVKTMQVTVKKTPLQEGKGANMAVHSLEERGRGFLVCVDRLVKRLTNGVEVRKIV